MKTNRIISMLFFSIFIASSLQAKRYVCTCKNNKMHSINTASSYDNPNDYCRNACKKNDGGLKSLRPE